jgi:cullin-associated NEDD8-dissociated protein 1
VHKKLAFVKERYDAGQAAFVSNIGALVEPTTRTTFQSGSARTCVGLFSHSDQVQAAQTLKCQIAGAAPRGVGGRMADVLASDFTTTSFSVSGTTTWSQGFDTNIEIVNKNQGAVRLTQYEELKYVIGNITSQKHGNAYCEEYARQLGEAVESSETLGALLDGAALATNYPVKDTSISKQLHQVARIIATREDRMAERDLFYVSLGGFDSHSDVIEILEELFKEIDDALRDFVAELEGQGVFDNVVVVTSSDFGRSLTSNGKGTDHAWAGQHFVLGGKVNGGRIYNDYPASLMEGNPYDAGRGRLIPKYPWESLMVPIAEWLGVRSAAHGAVFPNLENFNTSYILSESTLFRA